MIKELDTQQRRRHLGYHYSDKYSTEKYRQRDLDYERKMRRATSLWRMFGKFLFGSVMVIYLVAVLLVWAADNGWLT